MKRSLQEERSWTRYCATCRARWKTLHPRLHRRECRAAAGDWEAGRLRRQSKDFFSIIAEQEHRPLRPPQTLLPSTAVYGPGGRRGDQDEPQVRPGRGRGRAPPLRTHLLREVDQRLSSNLLPSGRSLEYKKEDGPISEKEEEEGPEAAEERHALDR